MSSRPVITLDKFLARIPSAAAAFAAAYRREAETDPTFVPLRDEQDWFRDLSAYSEYVEQEEASR